MKRRILKKLCKKAAKYLSADQEFDSRDGDNSYLIGFWYKTSYEYDEYDWISSWEYLCDIFSYEFIEYEVNDFHWRGPKSTTINKLRWARNRAAEIGRAMP